MIRKIFLVVLLFILGSKLHRLNAAEEAPDTVKAGIYITSIHDIDFR